MKDHKRSYSVYKTMRVAVKRSGIENPGPTASVLLEAFLDFNGSLKADTLYNRKICVRGRYQFTDWRDELVKKDWLRFEVFEEQKKVRYSCGPKLFKYINREKISREEIATKYELQRLEEKMATKKEISHLATKKEVSQLEEKIKAQDQKLEAQDQKLDWIIEMFDPPTGEEKRVNFPTQKVKAGLLLAMTPPNHEAN